MPTRKNLVIGGVDVRGDYLLANVYHEKSSALLGHDSLHDKRHFRIQSVMVWAWCVMWISKYHEASDLTPYFLIL